MRPWMLFVYSSFHSLSPHLFHQGWASKVKLELYYETLCPYCSNLIVNYLFEIFESGLASITDLKLINAKISPNGTIICQHGINECILNFVEACTIDAWPDVKDHFPSIYCVESLVYHRNYTIEKHVTRN